MGISFYNRSSDTVMVSIGTWGNDGNPGSYAINPGVKDTWGRKDNRGYVLYLEQSGRSEAFYVLPGNDVVFFSMDKVTNNGEPVKPLFAPSAAKHVESN